MSLHYYSRLWIHLDALWLPSGCTVNPEIFGVKIFSDTSKNPKIKNTKIKSTKIIGVFNFWTNARIQKFFTRKFLTQTFLGMKIFGFTVYRNHYKEQ